MSAPVSSTGEQAEVSVAVTVPVWMCSRCGTKAPGQANVIMQGGDAFISREQPRGWQQIKVDYTKANREALICERCAIDLAAWLVTVPE